MLGLLLLLFSAFELSPLPKHHHPLSRHSLFNVYLNPSIPMPDGLRVSCCFSRLYSMSDLDLFSAYLAWSKAPYSFTATASQFGNPLYREIVTGLSASYSLKNQSFSLRVKPMFLSIKNYGSKAVMSCDAFTWTNVNPFLGFGFSAQNFFSTTYGTSENRPPLTFNAHILIECLDDAGLSFSALKTEKRPLRKSVSLIFRLSTLSFDVSYADNPGEFSAGFGASASLITSHYGLSSHSDLGYTHTACVFWEKNFQPRQKPRGQNTAFLPPDTVSVSLFPADINRVSAELLDRIPGIGPVLAKRIVDYRDEKGGIDNLEELLNVNGIGKNLYEKILPYLTTGETDGM